MTRHDKSMSCEQFQAQLAELVGSGQGASEHPHLLACDRCRALLAELETIAEAARQLFPMVEPPDEVWEHIELAIRQEEQGTAKPQSARPARSTAPPPKNGL